MFGIYYKIFQFENWWGKYLKNNWLILLCVQFLRIDTSSNDILSRNYEKNDFRLIYWPPCSSVKRKCWSKSYFNHLLYLLWYMFVVKLFFKTTLQERLKAFLSIIVASVGVCSSNSLAPRRGTRNLIYMLAFILLFLLTTSAYSTTFSVLPTSLLLLYFSLLYLNYSSGFNSQSWTCLG